MGKPFFAAAARALPHLVHSVRNGYRFRPVPWAPVLTLIELLGDPAGRRSLGEAGPQSVTGHDRHRTLAAFEALCLHAAGVRRP